MTIFDIISGLEATAE